MFIFLLAAIPLLQFLEQPRQLCLYLIKICAAKRFVNPDHQIMTQDLLAMVAKPLAHHAPHVISCNSPPGCFFADHDTQPWIIPLVWHDKHGQRIAVYALPETKNG